MTRKEYLEARAMIDDFDAIYSDMPDGAYWAIAEESGVDMYFQLEVDEYESKHKLGFHTND